MDKHLNSRKGSHKKPHKVHRYTPATQYVGDLTELTDTLKCWITSTTALTVQVTVFAIKASALAAVITSILVTTQERMGLPTKCSDRILLLKELSITDAADELFWEAHPELGRRQIRDGEDTFSREWWTYYKQVETCRKALQ